MDVLNKSSESKNMQQLARYRGKQKYLCNAPFASMSVGISGLVTPCCYMSAQAASFARNAALFPAKPLIDIWRGKLFEGFRNSMKNFVFPDECAICSHAVQSGNIFSVKLLNYDVYNGDSGFPQLLEIAPDNSCNLSCVMCSSLNSSAIARSRGCGNSSGQISAEEYIRQLELFIAHLKEIIVTGGEPFFSELSMSIMQYVIQKNPECLISVNTNGSILNKRVKQLLDKGKFKLNVSLDSLQRGVYENIRKGAKFDTFLKNLDYFSEYGSSNKRPISIAVCPLQLNYREMPQLLDFSNRRGFHVFYLHVFNAQKVALATADEVVLEQALALFSQSVPSENNMLEKQNAQQFKGLVANVESWLAFARAKKSLLPALVSDDGYYNEKMEQLFGAVYSLIQQNTPVGLQEKRFEMWKNKTNELFALLPEYFKSKLLCDVIFSISPGLYLMYVEKFSITDLFEYFISFGDETIAALTQ